MERSDVPSVCTGNFYYGFHYDEHASKEKVLKDITEDLESKFPRWKTEKRVIIMAMVIGNQSHAKEALIANGFVVAHEAFNYKYPDTSKTLTLLYFDMNNWKEKPKATAAPAKSPFGSPAGRQVGDRFIPRPLSDMELATLNLGEIRGSYQDFPKDGIWYANDGSNRLPPGMRADSMIDVIIRSPQGTLMVARHDVDNAYRAKGGYRGDRFNFQFSAAGNNILAYRIIGH